MPIPRSGLVRPKDDLLRPNFRTQLRRRRVSTFCPSDMTGLRLWLRAEDITGISTGGSIPSWPEHAGIAGQTCTQATGGKQPTYQTGVTGFNGYPVVRFTAASSQSFVTSSIALGGTSQLTVYMVMTASASGVPFESTTNGGTTNGAFALWVNPSSALETSTTQASGGVYEVSPWTVSSTTPQIMSAVWDLSKVHSGQMWSYRNGTRGAGTWNDLASGLTGSFIDAAWYIGSRNDTLGFLNGDVAEIIAYSGAHTAVQRYLVTNYLSTRYAIGLNTLAGVITFDGDSDTLGTASNSTPNPYPKQLIGSLAGDYDWVNFGTNGDILGTGVTGMRGDADVHIDPYLGGYGAYKVLCVRGGINEIQQGGADLAGDVSHERLAAYCRARKRVGWPIVVVGTLHAATKAGIGPNFESRRLVFNQLVRDHYREYADALADIGAQPEFDEPADSLNTTYYSSDAGHMSNGGYTIVASLFKTALAPFGVT